MSSDFVNPGDLNNASFMMGWQEKGARLARDSREIQRTPAGRGSDEKFVKIDDNETKKKMIEKESLETELIVKEIRSFRQHYFWRPELYHEDFISPSNKGNHTETNGPSKNPGMPLIVFDTSGLLQDTTLLPLCIEKQYHVLIPYTVLKELDGLKKTEYDKLRMKVVKTYGFLHDYSKSGCYYLHIENMFEASFGVKEFGCQNNDDIILKCVLVTTSKYTDKRASVIFVTNDKSLAVKAVAHNIITLNKNELLRLLTAVPQGSMNRPVVAGNPLQRMPFPKFSLYPPVPIRVSYQKIRNNLQPIFAHCSQPTFGPPMFTHPREKESLMPNNVFSSENRFQMPFWNLASTQIPLLPSPSSVEKTSEMARHDGELAEGCKNKKLKEKRPHFKKNFFQFK